MARKSKDDEKNLLNDILMFMVEKTEELWGEPIEAILERMKESGSVEGAMTLPPYGNDLPECYRKLAGMRVRVSVRFDGSKFEDQEDQED